MLETGFSVTDESLISDTDNSLFRLRFTIWVFGGVYIIVFPESWEDGGVGVVIARYGNGDKAWRGGVSGGLDTVEAVFS